MKNLLHFSVYLIISAFLISCGETTHANKEPNNFPQIKTKKNAAVYKEFGRGVSNKIVSFQQYYESKGRNAEKHLITISKPSNGRELKLELPLDKELIRKFKQLDSSKFESEGPIEIGKEHQFKSTGQLSYWQYHEENTSKDVYLKEGSYSLIRLENFEMLHIYDSKNDIEYIEMKMN